MTESIHSESIVADHNFIWASILFLAISHGRLHTSLDRRRQRSLIDRIEIYRNCDES